MLSRWLVFELHTEGSLRRARGSMRAELFPCRVTCRLLFSRLLICEGGPLPPLDFLILILLGVGGEPRNVPAWPGINTHWLGASLVCEGHRLRGVWVCDAHYSGESGKEWKKNEGKKQKMHKFSMPFWPGEEVNKKDREGNEDQAKERNSGSYVLIMCSRLSGEREERPRHIDR